MELGLEFMINRIILILSVFSICLPQKLQNLSNNQIPDLIDDVGSAVVMLLAEGDYYKDRALGSGVIVNNGDYVITNAHVVSGARKVVIKFFDGSQQTQYGYSSVDKRRDLVSIKIKQNDNIKSVDLRESSSVKIGESVVAIGNPQGLSHSVFEGIISGKREFEKGCVANLTASRIAQKNMRKMRLFQEKDYITIDFQQKIIEEYKVIEEQPSSDSGDIIVELYGEEKKYVKEALKTVWTNVTRAEFLEKYHFDCYDYIRSWLHILADSCELMTRVQPSLDFNSFITPFYTDSSSEYFNPGPDFCQNFS